ncbi:hypothetical protein ACFL59_13350, partial [Planctomycetota bacterium]
DGSSKERMAAIGAVVAFTLTLCPLNAAFLIPMLRDQLTPSWYRAVHHPPADRQGVWARSGV